jgi:hypothetical protein
MRMVLRHIETSFGRGRARHVEATMAKLECGMVDSTWGRTRGLRWTLELGGDEIETEDNIGHDDRVEGQ